MAVTADDVAWMRLALGEANRAAALGEVPIGAILVVAGQEIARGFNRTRTDVDPTAHAEVVVLRNAAGRLADERVGGTLYVTLEPCLMCMGALVQSRISRLVFGAIDPKAGAAVSLYRIAEDERLNHRFAVDGGALAEDCGRLLTGFFRELRR
jgi:tRNA(adenine34) deaminase